MFQGELGVSQVAAQKSKYVLFITVGSVLC